ncbi:PAS domain S-box protein, partial [Methanothrix sp.]|uniref:PAS domain S-box protein n=1 Tax=Methanothrix sp. TaxID=90426 RepID=UPI0034E25DEF
MGDKDFESRILRMLRSNIRGLTISQIATRLKINRNTTAKYLEKLIASGHVECRNIGTARVFTSAHRVPVTALLDFSKDMVCTIDAEKRFVYINNAFLRFLGLEETQVRGRSLEEVLELLPNFSDLLGELNDLEEGKESVKEKEVKLQDRMVYLRLKNIPTIF